jgi:NTE family protein
MNREKSVSARIGLALGSGSSRGWAHIGVIKALAEVGIQPDIICGCSIGALVGASYAAGNLDHLEQWALSLTRLEIARYFEINLSLNGFVDTGRLHSFLVKHVCNEQETIENLKKTYAAVSTELATGREKWFTSGPVIDAVWASISLPGLFPPMQSKGHWLVDGGLVNPVPVSLCRAMGADIVIAVNLNGDIVRKHVSPKPKKPDSDSMIDMFAETVKKYSATIFPGKKQRNAPPDLFNALASSINIMQDKITRSRMAGDPPDVLLAPKLSHIGLLEFYRAAEAIQEGRGCVNRMLPEIHYVAGMGSEGIT